MDRTVDAAVIGAGTAGINALAEIRKVTEDFVLVNGGQLGTTCARVGCMPSKIMIQIGDDYHRRQAVSEEGIENGERLNIEVARSMDHVRALRDGFVEGIISDVIDPLGDRFVEGYAEFLEPDVLKAGDQTIRAGRIVIATGSRPMVPRGWEAHGENLLTTDSIFEQRRLPESMAVIGLGPVGLELGQALKRMGVRITGVDRLERIGGLTDPEVNRAAVEIFEEEIPMFLGAEAGIEKAGSALAITAGGRAVVAEKALLSIGRIPNVDRLHLDRLGCDLGPNGVPTHDRHTMQVGGLPVFLAGDVTGDRPVLHEVAHEGTVAGYNAVHDPVVGFRRKAPLTICFSDPNICTVGASFDEVKDKAPAVGSARFDGGRERIMLRSGGLIRIYAEPLTGRLLGAEMIAPDGEHLAHLLAWSIQQDLTVADLLAMPFYHPTVEETLKGALTDLLGEVAGIEPHPLPGFQAKDTK